MNSFADTTGWPPSSNTPPLADNEVHVWAAPLDIAPGVLEKFRATLSPDEQERAAKYKFEKHRNRYIVARAVLRKILGNYLHAEPAALRFDYSTNGKPSLTPDFASTGIHFNLAHTDDLALIAVTRIGMIGIDVESVRPVKEMDALVARFFSAHESELFQNVAVDQKPAAFFNLWTRKEALLKATGEGITRSLSLVEVSFLPGEPARLLAISGDSTEAAGWTLRELSPAPGYTGAVAIQAQNISVRCRKWDNAAS